MKYFVVILIGTLMITVILTAFKGSPTMRKVNQPTNSSYATIKNMKNEWARKIATIGYLLFGAIIIIAIGMTIVTINQEPSNGSLAILMIPLYIALGYICYVFSRGFSEIIELLQNIKDKK